MMEVVLITGAKDDGGGADNWILLELSRYQNVTILELLELRIMEVVLITGFYWS